MASTLLRWQLCLILCLSSSMVSLFVYGGHDILSEELLSLKSELIDRTNSLSDWLPSLTITTNGNGGSSSSKGGGGGGDEEETNSSPPSSSQSQSQSQSQMEIQACSWSGVTCNSNATMLVGLDLSKRGLSGPLSKIKFHLFVDLLTLNLSYNSFSGPFPLEIFNLTNLTTLDISRNSFSGRFPDGSSGLNSLVTFDAFSNSFSGPLPAELSTIETLRVLNLAGSYFSGSIPPEFGSFRSLEFVHLAGNFLTAAIPPELGKLQTLIHMEIGYNSYQGQIPWQMGNMTRLEYLDIAGADLTGPIPPEIGNLTKLHTLFLFRNRLDGPIPAEFRNLVSLRSLDLSDNQISGPIPDGFSELKELRLLSLFFNDMSGSVPQAIAQLPMLENLRIWNNFFSGSLPQGLGRNSDLKVVDVSTNSFNGTIPPDLCVNGMLSKLIVFSNHFSGEIPPSLAQCSSLVRLRLEDNSLSGTIPLKFASLPDLSYVDLSRNKFYGGVPVDISPSSSSSSSSKSSLEYFNVSNNPGLGGSLPQGLWSLPHLRNFSASYCGISGDLPDFKSCKSVSIIELNSNGLTGSIPESVSDCKSLEIFDISNNSLASEIPKKLRSMPRSSFEGNAKLCGFPLDPCSGVRQVQTEFVWVLILCITVVIFIALAVSGLFYLQRSRQSRWKMVSFPGLPQLTADEVLKSLNSTVDQVKDCKALLPTGITVSVKKVEWEKMIMQEQQEAPKAIMGYVSQMGNARHKNLTRLLGYCYNNQLGYLLYEFLPVGSLADRIAVKREWASKYRIVRGIAEGLWFLHHDCFPAIPHGDLRLSNIVFEENSEPQLAEFGFKFLLLQLNGASVGPKMSWNQTDDEPNSSGTAEALKADIYSFGEITMEILTNGRMVSSGKSIQSKPWEALLERVYQENQLGPDTTDEREEMKAMLELALLCTRSRPFDRPSVEEVLKVLAGMKKR